MIFAAQGNLHNPALCNKNVAKGYRGQGYLKVVSASVGVSDDSAGCKSLSGIAPKIASPS